MLYLLSRFINDRKVILLMLLKKWITTILFDAFLCFVSLWFSYYLRLGVFYQIFEMIKKKAFIVGITGQDGTYMGKFLLDKNINESQITKISKLYKPNYLIINSSNKISFKSYKFIKSYGNYNIYLYSKKKIPMHKDLAVLLSTSGSTGSSKFVKFHIFR